METIAMLFGGLEVICLMGAILYGTKVIKARQSDRQDERRKNSTKAGSFFASYLILNVIRLIAEKMI